MIGKMITAVTAGMMMTVLGMHILLCSLPLFRRLEYDALCYKYVLIMDQAGGLSPTAIKRLSQEMEDRGFTVRKITGTEQARFGDELSFSIQADFTTFQITPAWVLKEVSLSFDYQTSLICRKIKSYAADP
ncbi:MAG: hypothetical protein VB070_04920 [Clostridiaceae bacterium]|nr:hypothetical protein [Clostridiaceae bacterium]